MQLRLGTKMISAKPCDVGEQNNLAEENPELVTTLIKRMEELDADVEKNTRDPWEKSGQ